MLAIRRCARSPSAGRGFDDTPSVYNRLPTSAKATVRAPVWDLGLNSAGLSVRFESNAANISVNYTLAYGNIIIFSSTFGLNHVSRACELCATPHACMHARAV